MKNQHNCAAESLKSDIFSLLMQVNSSDERYVCLHFYGKCGTAEGFMEAEIRSRATGGLIEEIRVFENPEHISGEAEFLHGTMQCSYRGAINYIETNYLEGEDK